MAGPEERMKFDMDLSKPIKGTPDRMSAEDEMAQLKNL